MTICAALWLMHLVAPHLEQSTVSCWWKHSHSYLVS